MKRLMIFAAVAIAAVLTLTGCGDTGKYGQEFNDAPVNQSINEGEATLTNMPDGFSNFANKCEGPNMVYVLFHSDAAYGAIAVVPNDPRCTDS